MPRIVAMAGFVLPWESQSSASAARGVRPSLSSGWAEEKSGLNSRFACRAKTAEALFDRVKPRYRIPECGGQPRR